MFALELSQPAADFFEAADAPLQRRLDRCFEMLKLNPYHHNNIKRLHRGFSGFWRYRVGDYRVIYAIDNAAALVRVAAIVHRREAYE